MTNTDLAAALAPLEGVWHWSFVEGGGLRVQERRLVIHGGEITEGGEPGNAALVDGQVRVQFDEGVGELRFAPKLDDDYGLAAEVWLMPAGWDEDESRDPDAEMQFFEHAYIVHEDG